MVSSPTSVSVGSLWYESVCTGNCHGTTGTITVSATMTTVVIVGADVAGEVNDILGSGSTGSGSTVVVTVAGVATGTRWVCWAETIGTFESTVTSYSPAGSVVASAGRNLLHEKNAFHLVTYDGEAPAGAPTGVAMPIGLTAVPSKSLVWTSLVLSTSFKYNVTNSGTTSTPPGTIVVHTVILVDDMAAW